MLREPAFMVYAADFMMETSFMSAEDTGYYIKILCNIHFHGHLTEKEMKYICGKDVPVAILRNLEIDEDGAYYHKRMEYDSDKRIKYSESRQKNLKKRSDSKKDEAEICAEEKKPYGSYKNVMLTDSEYEDLSERFRTGLDARINQLSSYMKINGKRYECHYAVIIQWDEKNKEKLAEEQKNHESTFDTDDFFEANLERSRRWMSEKKKDSG